MINKVSISNYKSIQKQEFPLAKVNVFIGENGCGKSNILEAVGMAIAADSFDLKTDSLWNKGIRVAKPSLTFNSFKGQTQSKNIEIILAEPFGKFKNIVLTCDNPDDIYANWTNKTKSEDINFQHLEYLIYNIHSNALRGFTLESKKVPLGIFGEGLDVLLSTFTEDQIEEIKSYNFISWLEDISTSDDLKIGGYKLGRSISKLCFTDKYMQKKNNLFSAENANEGALHVLFYLALLISGRTPSFFAIDNIETGLNPMLCRKLMTAITELAVKHDKQVLITTHNPAVLDGLNLSDENQKLFIVRRADEGQTIVEELKMKPQVEGQKYKLSELWMRGFIGGIPNNF